MTYLPCKFRPTDLLCNEDLNETEMLLREKVAGVWKFAAKCREKDNHEKLSIVDVGMEEAKLINALGMYSADDLYSFVNKLRSAVAIVNAEEQLELHRAKVLNIFDV